MRLSLEVDIKDIEGNLEKNLKRTQVALDSQIISDTNPYVPFKTGALSKSAITNSKIGEGKIIYNTPYARIRYYTPAKRYTTTKHPLATYKWFEVSKEKNMRKWLSLVEKGIKGK